MEAREEDCVSWEVAVGVREVHIFGRGGVGERHEAAARELGQAVG